ncbi:MAG: UvrD-helicase domain-containing protein, partial [Actinobacteria bacterium]|nr:UvrD-helicase domain-containing protein [Actinomycetota bacterium]NIS31242.1 UvrD-helicase domain-containing protein [Actinomycetota bacterium]NIT95554.1 UvrD-helicase domain-containing protein [Actinomycetota bacterium]NIU19248.1 UvrD-helicase domain-containing protein [Actinomycetota bacterium]NIU70664.1 UvrD-helicase domain-containing protein [Actinomycetota bacterium]
MTDDARLPADQDQRDRIRTERDETLFVEAGAGSGKTRALVERIESLVLEDGVPMEHIAAITFTEKAAAELRDRIRQRFEADGGERAREALEQLDGAAVGTLHSFAQRILSEHPVEAGLPPGAEVLDEIGSQIDFEERWRVFLDELLDDPTIARPLLILDAVRVKLDALRTVAQQMSENWDLVEARLPLAAPEPPRFRVDDLLRRFDTVLELRHECRDPGDHLLEAFDVLQRNRAALAGAFDEIDAVSLAHEMGTKGANRLKKLNRGRAANWPDVEAVRAALTDPAEACDAAVAAVTRPTLDHVGARLGRFVLD